MTLSKLSRREALAKAGSLAGAALFADSFLAQKAHANEPAAGTTAQFRFCLNTSTLRGQKLGIVKDIEIASKAGYEGIEPWMDGLTAYIEAGGKLSDLRKQITDSGLVLEDAIGFAEWIVDDEARRAKGLDLAKRQMDMLSQLGGKRIAAPPAGATALPKLDLLTCAERYRVLLEAGQQFSIVPQLELWGFSQNLNHLGECVCVAMETGHPNACVLADVFHLYKGGSNLGGIQMLGPKAIQVLHMNDFPTDIPRDKLQDNLRVYPGEGQGPVKEILRLLRQTGGQKILSLELFNREYWKQDALEVAKRGLASMKAVVQSL
ncbi:MAG: xylose isomerase [Verrucomicrobia bacterium]|nr:MAG: xylose isomerase [Verrucomicrobiota bacterium]